MNVDTKIKIATSLIHIINDLDTPMLMYQFEKDITKEALELYIKHIQENNQNVKVA